MFVFISLLIVGLSAARSVTAADARDIQTCTSGGSDDRIAACTRLAASHALDKANLAAVLYNRANAYREKSQGDLKEIRDRISARRQS